jgi:hypothetical protein
VRAFLVNGLLLVVSLALCLVAAEGFIRWADGLPAFAMPLPDSIGANATPSELDGVKLAAGVKRDWYFDDPPPLPNRHKPPDSWIKLDDEVSRNEAAGKSDFRRADMFKAWNSVLAGDPCAFPFLRGAPGRLFMYDPVDGTKSPPYRFLQNATTPIGLVTNQYGWRGPPVPFKRSPKTIRIVFVGASTTISKHTFPYSYPEFVGNWLNLWAADRKLDIRFEVMNAGRESVQSMDLATIVRQEVAPLRPDLVVYYEGANQFQPSTIVKKMPEGVKPPQVASAVPTSAPARWLRDLSYNFGLARRLQALLASREVPGDGGEWAKPDYEVSWPADVNEADPDLSVSDLPVNLNVILGDLDRIRADLAAVDSELALSSFKWVVKDGMVLNPIRDRTLLEYLNVGYFPFRYRDMERLANFQNRVYAKYAAAHGLPFIDVARDMPSDPELYIDAIHDTYPGVRLRAWIVFQQLLPVIEKKLASGAWPKPVPEMGDSHPAFRIPPREVTFQCKAS